LGGFQVFQHQSPGPGSGHKPAGVGAHGPGAFSRLVVEFSGQDPHGVKTSPGIGGCAFGPAHHHAPGKTRPDALGRFDNGLGSGAAGGGVGGDLISQPQQAADRKALKALEAELETKVDRWDELGSLES